MKFDLILADCAWSYNNTTSRGAANNHYSTLSLDDLKKLPVQDVCEKDALLFCWGVCPLTPECFEVIKAWGFKPKTAAFMWVKENLKSPGIFIGTGNYTRSNVEPCWLGKSGKGLPISDRSVSQVIISPRMKHSRKPEESWKRIERMYPSARKLELFATQTRDGWHCQGNAINGKDIREELVELAQK